MNTKPRKKKRAGISITVGSTNVFKDLRRRDANEAFAKMELAYKIYQLIEEAGLNQTQAARQMGTDRARVSNLMRGQLKEFSMERLFQFLNKLGQDVDVMIRPKRKKDARVHVRAA
ncbi:MAG TPA: helix-turn-helix transcriptional regulator [Chryseosolibacter sp.]|nr:helix-turn-helix transcriptional regulator [Chryseosolibacter sp.]